jgi:hypothetical protein
MFGSNSNKVLRVAVMSVGILLTPALNKDGLGLLRIGC